MRHRPKYKSRFVQSSRFEANGVSVRCRPIPSSLGGLVRPTKSRLIAAEVTVTCFEILDISKSNPLVRAPSQASVSERDNQHADGGGPALIIVALGVDEPGVVVGCAVRLVQAALRCWLRGLGSPSRSCFPATRDWDPAERFHLNALKFPLMAALTEIPHSGSLPHIEAGLSRN